MSQEDETGLAQLDATAAAYQQRGFEIALQPLNLLRDGGLGAPELAGGPGERALALDGSQQS
ncbi:hypothetical protein GCM10011608_54480 [Micromonospora sonchi]|uniref:Uncharacterized protein n=1 Tax=Micromonospora sonchi TaxID=1763543 RepID=A0A917U8G5_9ACTN|nr:hypothetical protein GCM10011608_54480 [Micromonospora sonchi]